MHSTLEEIATQVKLIELLTLVNHLRTDTFLKDEPVRKQIPPATTKAGKPGITTRLRPQLRHQQHCLLDSWPETIQVRQYKGHLRLSHGQQPSQQELKPGKLGNTEEK